jgi:hypothetical protein
MRIFASLLTVVLSALLPSVAWGLGSDHPGGPVKRDHWPTGLDAIVNSPERIHGYWVNWSDTFFFAGDTDKLNAVLESCEKLPNTKLEIVLHPGQGNAQSPWDKTPPSKTADWKFFVSAIGRGEARSKLDIWVGGKIRLADLKIPAKLSIKAGDDATEDAAIQDFVKLRTREKP